MEKLKHPENSVSDLKEKQKESLEELLSTQSEYIKEIHDKFKTMNIKNFLGKRKKAKKKSGKTFGRNK